MRMLIYQFWLLPLLLVWLCSPVRAEPQLVIATNELPPYISERPGQRFLLEIFDEIGKEMGVHFVYKFMPWKRCELAVERKEAWATIPYAKTDERLAKFIFSEPLFSNQSKFFYYAADSRPRAITYTRYADLRPYRIGGVIGYYYEQPFAEAQLQVEFVNTDEQNFNKLYLGRIDLVPADENVGFYLIRKNFSAADAAKFLTLAQPLNKKRLYLMTSPHYPDARALLARFNTAQAKLKKTGRFQQILDRNKVTLTY